MKNDCSIVRDLLPLYVEDMVSKDTAEFVDEHLKDCTDCSEELKMLKEGGITETESEIAEAEKAKAKSFKKVMKKLNTRFNSFFSLLIVFAIVLGAAWSESETLLNNILLMPIIGAFGYFVFSYKAFYKIPLLVTLTQLFIHCIKLVDYQDYFVWCAVVYSHFALIGVIIAWLLHFTFKKEEFIKNKIAKIILKVVAFCLALALVAGIGFLVFVFFFYLR